MNCQNCRQTLKLHETLEDLDPAALELLVGSSGQSIDRSIPPDRLAYPHERKELYERTHRNATSPVFKRVIPAAASAKASSRHDPTMSFAMLTDSEVMPARKASNEKFREDDSGSPTTEMQKPEDTPINVAPSGSEQIEAATRLFEILSSRSDIDHPICSECAELLLARLGERLHSATRERDSYITFLKRVNDSAPSASEVSKAQAALEASEAGEKKALEELKALEKEKADLEEELIGLEAESLSLDEEETEFWRSRNAFAQELAAIQNQRDALQVALEHDSFQLEQLRRTNVYNDALHITSDGTFATINGLRLGRLPPKHSVDWAEINAAWGYAALLLATVAEKLNFSFKGYKIKPMGSASRIEQEDYPSPQNSSMRGAQRGADQQQEPRITKLDLFSSGDIPLAGAILHRRINNGMVAFLECLRQLCAFVQDGVNGPSAQPKGKNPADVGLGMRLPYKIKNDKIGNEEKGYVSIRLNASNDSEWTDACKYTLTCCKYLLAAMGKILDSRDS